MPIKYTREELQSARANRAARNQLKIVQLQLKSILPLLEAHLDANTAMDIAQSLGQSADTCTAVAKRLTEYANLKKPRKPAVAAMVPGGARE